MSPELRELLSDVGRLDKQVADTRTVSLDLIRAVASIAYRARKMLREEEERYSCWKDLFKEERVEVTQPLTFIQDDSEDGWLSRDGAINPFPEAKQEAF